MSRWLPARGGTCWLCRDVRSLRSPPLAEAKHTENQNCFLNACLQKEAALPNGRWDLPKSLTRNGLRSMTLRPWADLWGVRCN